MKTHSDANWIRTRTPKIRMGQNGAAQIYIMASLFPLQAKILALFNIMQDQSVSVRICRNGPMSKSLRLKTPGMRKARSPITFSSQTIRHMRTSLTSMKNQTPECKIPCLPETERVCDRELPQNAEPAKHKILTRKKRREKTSRIPTEPHLIGWSQKEPNRSGPKKIESCIYTRRLTRPSVWQGNIPSFERLLTRVSSSCSLTSGPG